MRAYPFIEIAVAGRQVNQAFYDRLVEATIHDAPGQDADTLQVKLDDARNELALPAEGDKVTVRFGFRDGGSFKMGLFVLEQPQIEGGEQGEFITLNGRSADMRDELKEPRSEHFDDITIGGLVQELAGRHGYRAKVAPALAGIQLPYLARVEQPVHDLLTRLADRHRAQFAVKDGAFLFLERGKLPALSIDRSQCASWNFTLNPRPRFKETGAPWFDRAKAKWVFESHQTGLQGPMKRLRMGLPSQAEAKAAAEADGDRSGRASASGSIELAGLPEAMADTPIMLTGFRPEANGEWRAASVEHRYADTYTTTIELEAPEKGRT